MKANKCPVCGYNVCVNCKFFHELDYGFKRGKGYKKGSCCIALTRVNEDIDKYESFVIETTKYQTCEMFTEK